MSIKNRIVHVRVSEQEAINWQKQAAARGYRLSDFIREAVAAQKGTASLAEQLEAIRARLEGLEKQKRRRK